MRSNRWVNFLVRADPVWVGLHDMETTEDGRSYRWEASHFYPTKQWGGVGTVVLHGLNTRTIVHELAHALHYRMWDQRFDLTPVNWYALTNRFELYAEAVTHYVMSCDCWPHNCLDRLDHEILERSFEHVAAGRGKGYVLL